MTFNIPSYKWRGKTYKNVNYLCHAVMKRHPDTGVSFDKTQMFATRRTESGKRFVVAIYDITRPQVAGDFHIIADEPNRHAAGKATIEAAERNLRRVLSAGECSDLLLDLEICRTVDEAHEIVRSVMLGRI